MQMKAKVSSLRLPLLSDFFLFFRFLGHLSLDIKTIILGQSAFSKTNFLMSIFNSGVKMTIPLMLICSLMGASLILNIYHILSPLYLQNQVLLVAQNILFYDLLPFVIGLVLSIQLALNLINARANKFEKKTSDIILDQIIPLILGSNISTFVLYIYCFNAIFITIYFCFRVLLNTDLHEYLFHLTNTITTINILFSILKTLIYCTIVSLVVGYYYYCVASRHLSLRIAMSRIMTRSLVFLTVSSIYFKFFSY